MRDYILYFPDFFLQPVTKLVRAETAGKAKYLSWLTFRDAYDLDFIDFLKIVKVWVCKDIESTESTQRSEGRE